MFAVLLAFRWGIFKEGRFMGRVLDEWTADSQEFLHTKLPHLIVVALIAFLFTRILNAATRHMVHAAERNAHGTGRVAEVKTLAGVIRATGLAVIGVIAGLQFLGALGFDLAPLLASAGVAGIAIGLAAQNIVKDVFNGMLILIEGQFNVGDTVKIAGASGVVETMTLRKTTLRDGDGTLYVIPNSQITTVANLSVGFSVATIPISVDFSANPDAVMALLRQIANDLRNSDEFRDLFVADPQILGVDAVKGSQMIFPVVFKTLPTKQYGPIREFQRRVRLAMEERSLLPGDPYRVFKPSSASAASTQEAAETAHAAPDPTTIKPQEINPFSGE